MQTEPQITFKDMEQNDALQQEVRDWVAELEQFYDRITSCRVVLTAPHRHGQKGTRYAARIDLGVPGEEIVVNREHRNSPAHEDVHVALRDAFRAARRQLEDHVRRARGYVKTHEAAPHGRVARLLPEQDCGFIETSDGRELYFHRNSVLDAGFEQLAVGTAVRFHESQGEKGPTASTVRAAGRHNQSP